MNDINKQPEDLRDLLVNHAEVTLRQGNVGVVWKDYISFVYKLNVEKTYYNKDLTYPDKKFNSLDIVKVELNGEVIFERN